MADRHWHITGKVLTAVIAVAVVMAMLAFAAILRRGLSSRDQPTMLEATLARLTRRFAMPATVRTLRNPIPLTADALAAGRAHFADHCASCHANDGSGQTDIGRNLYPKSPDMRSEHTQALTDGELFWIIKNGVRLTGMPAWGDAAGHDDADNWKLVHFIRHLPKITPSELEQMKAMNPVSPMEREEESAEAKFLEGGDAHASLPADQHH
jgi:mono/diheme cytochrome c family protein